MVDPCSDAGGGNNDVIALMVCMRLDHLLDDSVSQDAPTSQAIKHTSAQQVVPSFPLLWALLDRLEFNGNGRVLRRGSAPRVRHLRHSFATARGVR